MFDSETQESRDSAYAEPQEEYPHEHGDHYAPPREHNHGSGEHRHRETRYRSRDREQDHNEGHRQRSRHKSKDRYCDKDGEGMCRRRNEAGEWSRDVYVRQ